MRFLFSSIILFLVFCSCEEENRSITEDEISEFVIKIDKEVKANNTSFINNLIDYSFVEKEAKEKGILNNSLDVVLDLDSYITSEIFSSGEFVYLNKRKVDDETFVISYRFLGESDFDYFDFTIKKNNGYLRISNVFPYSRVSSLNEEIINFLEKKSSIEYHLDASIRDWISDIYLAIKYNKEEKAKGLYRELIKQYNSDSFGFVNFKRDYACAINDTILAKAMTEKLNEIGSNENRFTLRNELIYLSTFYNNHSKLISTIYSLKTFVGNDYLLDYLKGNSYLSTKDYKKADSIYSNIIERHPSFSFPYYGKIEVALKEKKYSKAISLFKKLGIEDSPTIYFKEYPHFLDSDEFKEAF